jgi:hypothetical protein
MTPEGAVPDPSANGGLSALEIEQTLATIVQSEEFGRSNRLADLLRFIVQEEMSGRGPRLKAYAIATEVLGRGIEFDAAHDSIVRVEIARLRTALKLFYSRDVPTAAVIDIPKGGYRAVISRRFYPEKNESPARAEPPAILRRKDDPKPETWLRRRTPLVLLTLAAAVAAAMFAWRERPAPARSSIALPPLVLVSPVTISSADLAMRAFERGLKGELVAQLSAHQWMSVAYRSEAGGSAKPDAGRSVYTVNMNLVIEANSYSSVTTLQDAASGSVRATYMDKGVLPGGQVFPSLAASARRIASDIGMPLGTLTQAELESTPEQAAGPYSCLLSLRRYVLGWAAADREAFRACALATPQKADAASLGLAAYADLDEARQRGGASRSALIAAACQGRLTQLETISSDILRMRPNDPGTLSALAHIRGFVLGDIPSAVQMAQRARELAINPQPDDTTVPALGSLMRGDWAATIGFVNEPPRSTNPLALLLLIAAQGETADQAGVRSTAAALARAGFPDADSIRGYVANECLADNVRKPIEAGVLKALQLL